MELQLAAMLLGRFSVTVGPVGGGHSVHGNRRDSRQNLAFDRGVEGLSGNAATRLAALEELADALVAVGPAPILALGFVRDRHGEAAALAPDAPLQGRAAAPHASVRRRPGVLFEHPLYLVPHLLGHIGVVMPFDHDHIVRVGAAQPDVSAPVTPGRRIGPVPAPMVFSLVGWVLQHC